MFGGVILASVIWGWLVFSTNVFDSFISKCERKNVLLIISIIAALIWLWNCICFFLGRYENALRTLLNSRIELCGIGSFRIIASFLFALSFYGTLFVLYSLTEKCFSAISYLLYTSDKIERVYFTGWTILCGIVLIILYSWSTVYYSGGYINILYTFDSDSLFNRNTFMLIGQSENDIRQSLFAFFSLPVSLPAAFLSLLLPFKFSYAFFLQFLQDMLISIGIVLVVRLLKLEGRRKIAAIFMLSAMCSTVFFALIIEQYIILVFWMITGVYCISYEIGDRELCAVSIAGTAPASCLILLWEYKNSSSLKEFLVFSIRSFLKFICSLICLGQLGLIVNFSNNIKG